MGNADWLNDAVESVRSACENAVNTNFSLWVDPDPDYCLQPGPNQGITNSLCPDECNRHGVCAQG